jgi:hypothetical protein
MSSPSRPEGHADPATKPAHEGHAHDDHAHAFDPEPAREMAADEPRTPGWLPLLGITLFVVGGTYFLATGASDAAPDAAASASAAVAPATPTPPAPGATGTPRPLPIPAARDREKIKEALDRAKAMAPGASGSALAPPGRPPTATARPGAPPPPVPPRPPAPPVAPGGPQ